MGMMSFKKELFAVLKFATGIFLLTALLSFHPSDPSLFSYVFPAGTIHNLCGKIGANFSAWSVHYFGLGALLLPLGLLVSALASLVFGRDKSHTAFLEVGGWLIVAVSAILILSSTWPHFKIYDFQFATGGLVGRTLSGFLSPFFGKAGMLIVSITGVVVGIYFVLQLNAISVAGSYLRNFLKEKIPLPKWSLPKFFKKSAPRAKVVPSTPVYIHSPDLPDEEAGLEFQDEPVMEEEDLPISYASPISSDYTPPPLTLFKTSQPTPVASQQQKKEFEFTANQLTKTFLDFGVAGEVIAIQPGPVVTVFEFQPIAGTKLAKIINLQDDIALALKVDSIFIYPVRGKQAVGVQVPNTQRQIVRLGDILQAQEFQASPSPLTLGMGKSIAGEPICADLTKMPHLLTAGATGAGKSVAINALLCSTIMKASPHEVRMILVDPKMLELSIYEGIPHLLMPVITEPAKASLALKWAIEEMEKRYHLMQLAKVRHISALNEFWAKASREEKDNLMAEMDEEINAPLPYILIVIDELADLMLQAPKDVETSIQRLAQKARASGIHLVLATQRPSVDIITGVIKANLPCRAAFQVVSKHDSRTILDSIGAEKLLGNGDMLFLRPGTSRVERIQGAFVSDEEVIKLVEFVKQSAPVHYDHSLIAWIEEQAARMNDNGSDSLSDMDIDEEDPKYALALQIASRNGYISASYLQRQLKIGYNRAARMVELMEAKGLLAKADGVKPRKWLGTDGGGRSMHLG